MRGAVAIVGVAIAIAALAGPARAEDRGEAERYFAMGEKAYKQQNFMAAAASFEKAYASLPLPEIAFSAAQAYRRQYRVDHDPAHVLRAIDLYNRYLEKVKTGGRVADAADALEELDRERARLARAGVKIEGLADKQRTWVGVIANLGLVESSGGMHEVSDVQIAMPNVAKHAWVDGKPTGEGEQVEVKAGRHELRVEADGYQPAQRMVAVAEGQGEFFAIDLAPKPARVRVETARGAQIAVDGRPKGTAPLDAIDLPAGKHLLAVTRSGHVPVVRELVVTRGQELVLTEKLARTTRRKVVPWMIGGAIGFATLSLGASILAAVENHYASVLDAGFTSTGNRPPSELSRYENDLQWRQYGKGVAFSAGAVAIALGAAAFLLYYNDNPSPERVRVAPVIAPGAAGVALTRGF